MWNLWKKRSQNHPAKPPLYSWLTETVWGSKPYCFKLQSFYQYSKQKFYSWWRDGEGRACALKTPSPQRKGNNESFLNWSIVDLQSCTMGSKHYFLSNSQTPNSNSTQEAESTHPPPAQFKSQPVFKAQGSNKEFLNCSDQAAGIPETLPLHSVLIEIFRPKQNPS